MAYRIQPSPDEAAELRKEVKPVQNSLGLLDLAGSDTSRVNGVQQFAFSGDGEYLAFLKYAPEGAGRGVGQALLVRDLAQGTEMHFGNVGEFAWAGRAIFVGIQELEPKPNQVDYHHRQLEWFGHYLKGEPAPDWIPKGVSWIDQEKKRAKR
jgi:hypothetical protein